MAIGSASDLCATIDRYKDMSFMERALLGKQIEDVWVDSEGTYLTLADGTVVTIRGVVVVEPRPPIRIAPSAAA